MINYWNQATDRLNAMPAPDMNLFVRIWIAKIFYDSGRTKVGDGFLDPSETTLLLFREEYRVPLLSREIAAHLAVYAETVFPILLILGLATRLSSAALLGMTLVIQIFVYPQYWTEHLLWAAGLVFLVLRGGGVLSVDRLLGRRK